MSLGKKLKERRTQLGFSREALAFQSKVGQKSIYNYENDFRNPTVKDLQKIAKALNTTVSWLLDEHNAQEPNAFFIDEADEEKIADQIFSLRHRPDIRKAGILRIIANVITKFAQDKNS